ncbi:hypothetical protein KC19_1G268900 [Ceratodon purpureus]|uniref:Uncharacterized protein n=1 Tax=Ceratodon purpureus TaxID=3225 RepID=A0A8T0JC95_CERPU|nr:hypothetical protein KC19_1G268900 [Ceratodon purpureus]
MAWSQILVNRPRSREREEPLLLILQSSRMFPFLCCNVQRIHCKAKSTLRDATSTVDPLDVPTTEKRYSISTASKVVE